MNPRNTFYRDGGGALAHGAILLPRVFFFFLLFLFSLIPLSLPFPREMREGRHKATTLTDTR